MAHRILRDVEGDGWERSDFPIICEPCLGDNPYIRIQKQIMIRSARFAPDHSQSSDGDLVVMQDTRNPRFAKLAVRDTALSIDSNYSVPKSDVNREYFAEEHDRRKTHCTCYNAEKEPYSVSSCLCRCNSQEQWLCLHKNNKIGLDYESSYGKARPNDTILKLQRTTPYYKRNRAHVCSFYIRGQCTRGVECPYRHEMPETGELSQQNIKDHYYGINDLVALKLLNKAGEMPSLETPDDESIKTLYIGGLDARISEQDLRDHFYAFGEIESVKLVLQRACAFVTYTTREAAEKAAGELSNKLVVKGPRLKLTWGRPQKVEGERARRQQAVASGLLPRGVISQQNQMVLPPGINQLQPRGF